MSSDDSKPSRKQSAKEEEEGRDDKKSLNSMVGEKKGRPSANANANPSKPITKVMEEEGRGDSGRKPVAKLAPSKVKKEETEEDEDDNDDDKPIARRASVVKAEKKISVKKEVKEEDTKKVVKVEVKKRKTNVAPAEAAATEQNGKKREKKVYDLPGQKRDPPEERDPLRIFYETLFKQIPHSEMAQFWMMESGLLPREEAKKVFEKKQKSKLVSPSKSPLSATATKTVSSTVSSAKKTSEVKVSSKQSTKRKGGDGSSDNDFFIASRVTKMQKAS